MADKTEEKYEVLEKIGQGSFGIIRKVRSKATCQILCRKEISYTRMSDKEKSQLQAELVILESLRHPNIVKYFHREHLRNSHDLHLYMEYCGNGDLGSYIKKQKERNQYPDEDFVWSIFAQLTSALYRCHYGEDAPQPGEEGRVPKSRSPFQSKEGYRMILHRDLKPENVFLGENNSVKLGDFGLSKIIASHDFASTYVGTPYYMSPEICAAELYSHHSDIWSLGCIIYELATLCVPFDARNHIELMAKIKAGRIKPLPPHYSKELGEMIAWCLKVDPRSRPDTAQLLAVPSLKLARTRLQQIEEKKSSFLVRQERDAALAQLSQAQAEIENLKQEVQRLKEAEKKMEMEWHARKTLAIDQRVHEQVEERQVKERPVKERQVKERRALARAHTYTNCNNINNNIMASPKDVQMTDPSPMKTPIAPMSIKSLSLSPRKTGQAQLPSGLRRNLFNTQAENGLRPAIILTSPAKWDPAVEGENMPSPFKKGGTGFQVVMMR